MLHTAASGPALSLRISSCTTADSIRTLKGLTAENNRDSAKPRVCAVRSNPVLYTLMCITVLSGNAPFGVRSCLAPTRVTRSRNRNPQPVVNPAEWHDTRVTCHGDEDLRANGAPGRNGENPG
jgi:hypothetical protein